MNSLTSPKVDLLCHISMKVTMIKRMTKTGNIRRGRLEFPCKMAFSFVLRPVKRQRWKLSSVPYRSSNVCVCVCTEKVQKRHWVVPVKWNPGKPVSYSRKIIVVKRIKKKKNPEIPYSKTVIKVPHGWMIIHFRVSYHELSFLHAPPTRLPFKRTLSVQWVCGEKLFCHDGKPDAGHWKLIMTFE